MLTSVLVALWPLVTPPAQWREERPALRTLVGERQGARFGHALAAVGDLDGDGVSDFAVGAPHTEVEGPEAGRFHVFSGKSGEELFRVTGEPGELLGSSLAGVGDVNGDGRGDVASGAPDPRFGPGTVRLYSGVDGALLARIEGEAEGDEFGAALAAVGDWDGDGRGDFAVGAPRFDGKGEDAGRVYLVSGKGSSLLAVLDGEGEGDRFGAAVAGRAQGGHLLIVGAPGAGPTDEGRAHVFRGAEPQPTLVIESGEGGRSLGRHVAVVGDLDGDGVGDVLAADPLNGLRGARTGILRLHSGADGSLLATRTGFYPGEGFGCDVGEAGDYDGDGRADLIVGAWSNVALADAGGRVYLISGADGSQLATWTGDTRGASLGTAVVALGDVDGDGRADFAAGAAFADSGRGRVHVLSGARPKPLRLPAGR